MKTPLIGLMKLISWVLVFAFMNMTVGCRSYFVVKTPTNPVDELIGNSSDQGKIFILHIDNKAWILESPAVSGQNLTGIAEKEYVSVYQEPIDPRLPNHYKVKTQSVLLSETHIYANGPAGISSTHVSIPLLDIQKIDLYKKDKTATAISHIAGGIPIVIGGTIIIFVIAGLLEAWAPF
jgi:hypothetical protein